ncbi:hypothetical protein [Allosphingosinicella vermicomposti]|uniref:hypothetical protein n=1 Tax=Allosphingosinicella vermicomposti TaxID=614671 RepID=UPI000D10C998|nr:hypothetical protein [Allosphingosinicella vermicomposti]
MSPVSRQRARIARVRHIQHDLAAAAASEAKGKVNALEMSAEHLARLRAELTADVGTTNGATIGSMGELALRIEQAREGLERSLDRARSVAEAKDQVRLAARIQQESADKLKDRASAADEAREERKISASIRPKFRSARQGDDA